MTIYEKNLKTLAKHYPGMDEWLENVKENLEPELELIEEESYDGEKILKVKKDGLELYLNGKRNAKGAAKSWMDCQGTILKDAVVFLFGVGNYFYLKELVERTDNRITIVVCEPSMQIFLKFLELVELEKWMEKHLIVFWVYHKASGVGETVLNEILGQIVQYETMSYSRRLISPNYEYLFPELSFYFLRRYKDIVENQMYNYKVEKRFSDIFGINVLSNIRYLINGYKTVQLADVIPRDIPGIVVAAGPSLNKNIEQLKNAKGKAFIIAVDTAIKPLLEAGVVPDMLTIVDARKPLHLIQKEGVKEIPLVTTISAATEILDYHTGKKFFFNEGVFLAEKFFAMSKERFGDMTIGGSVATLAFNLLYRLGIERIILVGQDLAFTGNKSHADGTFKEKMETCDCNTKKFTMVEGNVEEWVPTRGDFQLYIEWYEKFIGAVQKQDENFRVINATEGGAKIKGTEILTLKEAIEQECTKEVDIAGCIEKLKPMFNGENRIQAVTYLKKIPQEFHEIKTEALKLQKLYEKLDAICSKRKIDENAYLKVLLKLKKQIEKIEAQPVYDMIAHMLKTAHLILQKEAYQHEATIREEGKEISRKGIIYTKEVQKYAAIFEDYTTGLYDDIF